MPAHLQPTAPLAPRALLHADPGRAMALAQALTSAPRMFNHSRGLWGYTGVAADGEPLTVQSLGIGGPSAATVLDELCDLGLKRAIALVAGVALEPELAPGEAVVVAGACALDGASRALGAGERVAPDATLLAALRAASDARVGVVATYDLLPAGGPQRREAGDGPGTPCEAEGATDAPAGEATGAEHTPVAASRAERGRAAASAERGRDAASAGAVAADMQTASLLRVGALRGVAIATLLVVTSVDGRGSAGDEAAFDEELGRLALSALAPQPSPSVSA